ncbi:hypothetical protein HHL16_13405 [Pseudoflavitalea sp. G-6-1-2]|uniref:DUF6620 family protein n=1 Tax=Pseudoflavitalea sp. G-6-1-2 TaxID=2728841 RepID=UPI00146D6513|nr:DUF6620 family protein [Pseudoflavitalea sp. G-6-1-2]NML21881.1 hypothetical protein [Pseudoflavitalea sp. G-6-1-2]
MFKKLFSKGNNEEQKPQEEPQFSAPQEIEFDEDTLHGTHYDEEDFDAEVARQAEAWIADEEASGERLSEADKRNIYTNYRKQLYREWNNADDDQVVRFEMTNSLKYTGMQTSGFIKDTGSDNPYLAPVHGLSLRDYAAMVIKLTQGVSEQEIFKAMGIDQAIWDELNTIWPQRMGEDTTFTVTTLYGQYFAEPATLPQLESIGGGASNPHLDKIKTDRYYYEELAGARQAAYEYGLDGAQWIQENFGISLGDFQSVAMQWLTKQNQEWNSTDITHYHDYQQQKQKEYAAKFAAEQGGNVADDIDF